MIGRGQSRIAWWAVWVLADVGVLAATWTSGLGASLAGHAAVVAAGCAWLGLRIRNAPGWRGLLAFSGIFALLNPVVGPGVAGWLLRPRTLRSEAAAEEPAWIVGNPETGDAPEDLPPGDLEDSPLLSRLQHSQDARLRGPIARLRRDFSQSSLDLLRRIVTAGDARTQLIAKSAVRALREPPASPPRRLRESDRERPGEPRTARWLASAVRASALAGIRGEEESRQDLAEAARLYESALQGMPRDVEALAGLADCLWRLGRIAGLRNTLVKLSAIPGAEAEMLLHGCRLHCLEGDWRSVHEQLSRSPGKSGDPQLVPSRVFWLHPPPTRHE